MAGKTIVRPQDAATATAKKPGRQPRDPATKPGPKAAAEKALATAPKGVAGAEAALAKRDDTFDTVQEVSAVRKVFLENMAHALIFDIFQMQTVLQAIRDISNEEVDYLLDFYASRLRPLLIEDRQDGKICALLDLGVWYALEGQEEILTVGLLNRLGGEVHASPKQVRELAIEAVYGSHRDDSPSRGERWMPALHRNSSREDMQRVSPRHERDERQSRRAR